jgi:hypothetical protein
VAAASLSPIFPNDSFGSFWKSLETMSPNDIILLAVRVIMWVHACVDKRGTEKEGKRK